MTGTHPINYETAISYEEATDLKVGDELISGTGVGIRILKIIIASFHRHPQILIEYFYDDNGHVDIETVAMKNFYDNLMT